MRADEWVDTCFCGRVNGLWLSVDDIKWSSGRAYCLISLIGLVNVHPMVGFKSQAFLWKTQTSNNRGTETGRSEPRGTTERKPWSQSQSFRVSLFLSLEYTVSSVWVTVLYSYNSEKRLRDTACSFSHLMYIFTAQLNENDVNPYMKTDLYFRRFGLQWLKYIQKILFFSFFYENICFID